MKNFLGSVAVSRLLLLSILFIFHPAVAEELESSDKSPSLESSDESSDNPLSLKIHGFVSQGAILTTGNNYLMESKRGSFDFTEVGINFTKPLTNKLRMGLQLFSRKLGSVGNYDIKADWFYLDYRFRDEFGIRIGRIKLPIGFYNDTSDIDSARVPILLPQSVYPTILRDFLLAQNGGELYGRIKLKTAGALDYRLFGGVMNIDALPPPLGPFQFSSVENPTIVGGHLLWETPLEGLRMSGNLQHSQGDAGITIPSIPTPVTTENSVLVYVTSVEYALRNLLLTAEYSRWHVTINSKNPTIFPSIPTGVQERFYGMASYRFTNWFQPGAYYSVLYPNVDNRSGRENQQHDITATLRFDINPYWLVKLEGHYMHGTADLDPALNNNTPKNSLDQNWTAFLIKTTAYF